MKRGTLRLLFNLKSCLTGESGVWGMGVSVPRRVLASEDDDAPWWDWPIFLNRLLGAPYPAGALENLDSTVADVGRSSKISSSVPSPKLRLRAGLVIGFFAWAASSAGVKLLRRPGVSGLPPRRDMDLCAMIPPSLDPSESLRLKCRPDLMLICCDCPVDGPAGKKGAEFRAPSRDSVRSVGVLGRAGMLRRLGKVRTPCRDSERGNVVGLVGEALSLFITGIDLLAFRSWAFVVVGGS